MQSEFTALQGALHNSYFKQEFEQTKIFKLNKHIFKMAYYVQIE